MSDTTKYPKGWDQARVEKLIAHYEGQTDEEAIAEDEAFLELEGQTLMEVPNELVPKVRDLIAKHSES